MCWCLYHFIQYRFFQCTCSICGTYIPPYIHIKYWQNGIFDQLGGHICLYIYFIYNLYLLLYICIFMYAQKYLYSHLACWPCELYLEHGIHICWVMYVKYICSGSCCTVDTSDLMWHIYMHTSPVYACQVFGIHDICALFSEHICFWYILAIHCEVCIAVGYVLSYICVTRWLSYKNLYGTTDHINL